MKTYYFKQSFRGEIWGVDSYRVKANSEEEALELIKNHKGECVDSWENSDITEYDDLEFDYSEDEED